MSKILEWNIFIFTFRFDVACDQSYIPYLSVPWLRWSLMECTFEESGHQWMLPHIAPINFVMDRGYCRPESIEGSVLVALSK